MWGWAPRGRTSRPRGAQGGHGALRRSGGLHITLRATRSRGCPRLSLSVLRAAASRIGSAWRHGREIHRGRSDAAVAACGIAADIHRQLGDMEAARALVEEAMGWLKQESSGVAEYLQVLAWTLTALGQGRDLLPFIPEDE